jgi:hypothetical protein
MHTTVPSQEKSQHVSPEYRYRGRSITVPYEEGHQYLSSEHCYPEGSIRVPFPKGYRYLSPELSRLSMNTTARSEEDSPYVNPEHYYLGRRATVPSLEIYEQLDTEHTPLWMGIGVPTQKEHPHVNSVLHYLGRSTTVPTWEGYEHLNPEHTRLGMDATPPSQEGNRNDNPESHYLGRSIRVPSQGRYEHLSSEHNEFGRDMRMQFDEEYQHQNSEHAEFGRGVTGSSQDGHQVFNSDHTGLGIVVTGSSQEGHKHLKPEHTRPGISVTVPSQDGNQYLSLEHIRPGMSTTVPSMEGDEQRNTKCSELGIEVRAVQAALQSSDGPDTLPAEYMKYLYEEKLYQDTWQHRNVLSGLDLYDMFKMCHENEIMCMFGQGSHVACSPPPVQISPVILVCPLRMHPSFFCSWLGFLNDRHKHLAAVHRDCLVKGTSVELKVNGLALLSALNEVFLCYTLLETDTLYCVVTHACYYKACNSDFRYVTEVTNAITGISVKKGAAVATMFQTFKFLKYTHKCVSYCGINDHQLVKFSIYSPSEHGNAIKFNM